MLPLLRTLTGLVVGTLGARLVGLLGRFHVDPRHHGPRKTSRRTFTRNAALGSVGVVTAQIAAGFVYFFWPNKTGDFGSQIPVAAESVPPPNGEPYQNSAGKFYLVHNDDGLLALYWKCVHLGCRVPWEADDQKFVCPCHGSVYDRNGVREAGPAPRPLDLMPVSVNDDGSVSVDTGAITTRGGYDPSQAVAYTA